MDGKKTDPLQIPLILYLKYAIRILISCDKSISPCPSHRNVGDSILILLFADVRTLDYEKKDQDERLYIFLRSSNQKVESASERNDKLSML